MSDLSRETTTNVKRALQAAGFNVLSVQFGRGTARAWIEAKIEGSFPRDRDSPEYLEQCQAYDKAYHKAYAIVKHAAGRDNLHDDIQTDLFMECISVDFETRESWDRSHPKKEKKEPVKRDIDPAKCQPVLNSYGEPIEKYQAEPGHEIPGWGTPDIIIHGPRADFYLHRNKNKPNILFVQGSNSINAGRFSNGYGLESKVHGYKWFVETAPGQFRGYA